MFVAHRPFTGDLQSYDLFCILLKFKNVSVNSSIMHLPGESPSPGRNYKCTNVHTDSPELKVAVLREK